MKRGQFLKKLDPEDAPLPDGKLPRPCADLTESATVNYAATSRASPVTVRQRTLAGTFGTSPTSRTRRSESNCSISPGEREATACRLYPNPGNGPSAPPGQIVKPFEDLSLQAQDLTPPGIGNEGASMRHNIVQEEPRSDAKRPKSA